MGLGTRTPHPCPVWSLANPTRRPTSPTPERAAGEGAPCSWEEGRSCLIFFFQKYLAKWTFGRCTLAAAPRPTPRPGVYLQPSHLSIKARRPLRRTHGVSQAVPAARRQSRRGPDMTLGRTARAAQRSSGARWLGTGDQGPVGATALPASPHASRPPVTRTPLDTSGQVAALGGREPPAPHAHPRARVPSLRPRPAPFSDNLSLPAPLASASPAVPRRACPAAHRPWPDAAAIPHPARPGLGSPRMRLLTAVSSRRRSLYGAGAALPGILRPTGRQRLGASRQRWPARHPPLTSLPPHVSRPGWYPAPPGSCSRQPRRALKHGTDGKELTSQENKRSPRGGATCARSTRVPGLRARPGVGQMARARARPEPGAGGLALLPRVHPGASQGAGSVGTARAAASEAGAAARTAEAGAAAAPAPCQPPTGCPAAPGWPAPASAERPPPGGRGHGCR